MSKSAKLHTDVPENSIWAVLLQRDGDDINRPIAFISRTLSDRETGISASVEYSKFSF